MSLRNKGWRTYHHLKRLAAFWRRPHDNLYPFYWSGPPQNLVGGLLAFTYFANSPSNMYVGGVGIEIVGEWQDAFYLEK